MTIHPLAAVDPNAEIGADVEIGPFCVIDSDVVIGDGCRLASHVVVRSGTTIGKENQIFEGAILGGLPQHIRCPEKTGRLEIGNNNIIREHVTVHHSLDPEGVTRLGSRGLLMAGSHIAHDCTVGDDVIMANHVLLAGHVDVGDRVVFGGVAAVHQFCRVGQMTMVGGMARVHQDVPPFVTLDGGSTMVVGLNKVGLRRGGLTRAEIKEVKEAYQLIYRKGLTLSETIETLNEQFPTGPVSEFAEFFSTGSRGFVQERRLPPAATVRIFPEGEEDTQEENQIIRKVG